MCKRLFFYVVFISLLLSCNNKDYFDKIGIPAKQSRNGDYGIVSLKGELLVDFEIDNKPSLMVDNIAHFYDDEKVIFINNKGVETKTNYIKALHYNEGKALVILESGKLAFLNKEYKSFLTLNEIEEAGNFSEEVFKFKNKDNLWGFMDANGKIIVKPKYSEVKNFSEGLAMVSLKEGERNLKGYIDKEGNEVISLNDKYNRLSSFKEGLAIYHENDEIGFINKKSEEVIKNNNWKEVFPFHEGYSTVKGDDREYGLINKKGDFLIKTRERIPIRFYNNLAIYIGDNKKGGYINEDRKQIIRPEFNELLPFLSKGAYAKDGNNWLYIDKNGKEINNDNSLNIRNLYHEKFLRTLFEHNSAIDIEETLVSKFYDIEGFFNEFLNIESGLLFNTDILKKEESLKELYNKYLELSNTKDNILENVNYYTTSIDSYTIFNQNLEYNKDFSFSLRHYFDEKVKTKENLLNKDNTLNAIRLKVRLKNKARGKGKEVNEKIYELFEKNNFVKKEKTSNLFINKDKNIELKYNRSYNDITIYIKFLE